MASIGYIESLLNALPDGVKGPVTQAFRHAVKDGFAIGGVGDMERAENFRWYRFDVRTSSVANTEFSVHHGLNQIPLSCWPILPLDSSGGQIVRLKVTRPADAQRVYLSSPDTGASLSVMVEV
jgi:hypothetical protein